MRWTTAAVLLCVAACSEAHRAAEDLQEGAGKVEHAGEDASKAERAVEDAGKVEHPQDAAPPIANDSTDTCEVTTSSPQTPGDEPKTDTWTYDPATRRLVTTVYAYDLDEAGRSVNVYGIDRGEMTRYWTNHYDEHGNIDHYEHYTSGPTEYTNKYDAHGRLESVEMVGSGSFMLVTYRYDVPSAPQIWTLMEAGGGLQGAIESRIERTIENGRTAEVTKFPENDKPHHVFSFEYVGDRIDTIDRDGGYWLGDGPDGTANIRFKWVRDEEGNVSEFTQDGTDSFDNPVIDGTPDYKETFAAGCASLLKRFPWLAHEPAPNSIGPRFRTDAN